MLSPIRAAGFPPIFTVPEPCDIEEGGPTQIQVSPTTAAGIFPIKTVGSPGPRMGPPTWGIVPVVVDSPKDISFSAKGKISLDAMGEISISSKADLKAAGMNIEHNANVGLTSKGGASAELSAGGNTTVKGAMVMIN